MNIRAYPHTFELGDNVTESDPNAKPISARAESLPYAHKSWIQVARIGAYKGHPAGEFEFTAEVFAKMVANFEQYNENGMVPLDFEHASEVGYGDGSSAATGWIVQLQSRGEAGLWGLVEWLEPGLTLVRQRRYRFFSPTVAFNYLEPRTGKRVGPVLLSGALTNRPFLDGMAEVTARAQTQAHTTKEEHSMNLETLLASLKAALGDSTVTAENAAERVQKLRESLATAEGTVAEMRAKEVRASATAAVAELVAHGVIDAEDKDAIETAAELCMSSRAQFDSLFKRKLGEAKVKLSDAKSKQAPAQSGKSSGATVAADIAEDVRRQLSANISGESKADSRDVPKANSDEKLSMSERVAKRAEELAKSDRAQYALRDGSPNQTAYSDAARQIGR